MEIPHIVLILNEIAFFFSTFIKELLLFSFIAIFYGRKAIYGITKLLCF